MGVKKRRLVGEQTQVLGKQTVKRERENSDRKIAHRMPLVQGSRAREAMLLLAQMGVIMIVRIELTGMLSTVHGICRVWERLGREL